MFISPQCIFGTVRLMFCLLKKYWTHVRSGVPSKPTPNDRFISVFFRSCLTHSLHVNKFKFYICIEKRINSEPNELETRKLSLIFFTTIYWGGKQGIFPKSLIATPKSKQLRINISKIRSKRFVILLAKKLAKLLQKRMFVPNLKKMCQKLRPLEPDIL